MKIQLALLAVPFLALACTDAEQATLLEPPAISADVTIEAAPVPGQFTVEVRDPGAGCSGALANANTPSAGDWTLNTTTGAICVRLLVKKGGVNHGGGTLIWQRCRFKSTRGWAPKSACADKTGRFVTSTKRPVLAGAGASSFTLGAGITNGFRLKYRGQGSGLKNATIGPFDVIRPS